MWRINASNSRQYREAAKELVGNPGQMAVYNSTGNCVVLAGPGSGKTKTLTVKVAKILHEDLQPPSALACLTYSTECVRELERRLGKLSVRPGEGLFIGTVHSFCLKHIVMPFGAKSDFAVSANIGVASLKEQDDHFQAALGKVVGTDVRASDWHIRMDKYRRCFPDQDAKEFAETDPETARLIREYEGRLQAAGLIDFDGMVLLGLRILERHEWARRAIAAKYPVMVVDEYQDLGLPLHRIVLCLCRQAGVRLLAVGDPDQSIYGFTGAQPELLANLAKQIKAEEVPLAFNYRSGAGIVSASEIALGQTRNYQSKAAHGGTVNFKLVKEGLEAQADHICQQLIPAARARVGDCPINEVAVLYLDKNDGDVIAAAAEKAGFQYVRIDKGAAYRRTELLRWVEDCARWCAGGWRKGKPRLSALIAAWLRFNRTVRAEADRLKLRTSLVRFLFEHRDGAALVSKWLARFYSRCLLAALKREPALRDEAEAFSQLFAACGKDGLLVAATVASFAGMSGSPEHLNLITLHSAKGLEFDVVILMGMDQGKIPRWFVKTEEAKREPRRLFYVGVTRARKEVHLVCSGWYMTPRGPQNLGASEFVVGLYKKLKKQE